MTDDDYLNIIILPTIILPLSFYSQFFLLIAQIGERHCSAFQNGYDIGKNEALNISAHGTYKANPYHEKAGIIPVIGAVFLMPFILYLHLVAYYSAISKGLKNWTNLIMLTLAVLGFFISVGLESFYYENARNDEGKYLGYKDVFLKDTPCQDHVCFSHPNPDTNQYLFLSSKTMLYIGGISLLIMVAMSILRGCTHQERPPLAINPPAPPLPLPLAIQQPLAAPLFDTSSISTINTFLASSPRAIDSSEGSLYDKYHERLETTTPEFVCPITLEVFTDPVTVSFTHNNHPYSHTYERSALIEFWHREQEYRDGVAPERINYRDPESNVNLPGACSAINIVNNDILQTQISDALQAFEPVPSQNTQIVPWYPLFAFSMRGSEAELHPHND
ncbi:MAG: hypothetical protein Q7V63_07740 [Gammaproteobacteria bacterium]|nr:hypothetical protein [Gammaproteobacteria bacterium]